MIWHKNIPSSVSVFIWRLLHNYVPTDDNLIRKGFKLASKCHCCYHVEVYCMFFCRVFLAGATCGGYRGGFLAVLVASLLQLWVVRNDFIWRFLPARLSFSGLEFSLRTMMLVLGELSQGSTKRGGELPPQQGGEACTSSLPPKPGLLENLLPFSLLLGNGREPLLFHHSLVTAENLTPFSPLIGDGREPLFLRQRTAFPPTENRFLLFHHSPVKAENPSTDWSLHTRLTRRWAKRERRRTRLSPWETSVISSLNPSQDLSFSPNLNLSLTLTLSPRVSVSLYACNSKIMSVWPRIHAISKLCRSFCAFITTGKLAITGVFSGGQDFAANSGGHSGVYYDGTLPADLPA
ncbi:hypothetical protein M5K25_021804 [Dendrobium thyrsiflorum]|uniref:Reverse transcriptase zinc-binding domain-containing protein n=1 Tax=Dendrobium thyrsiflorum TaxID=117978 RepID=A0ABD0U554_DENTH